MNQDFKKKPKLKFKLKGKIPQWLDSEGIHYKESSTGELIIETCPGCQKENKLYVSEETMVAQCKSASCDFSTGISPYKLVLALLDCTPKEAFNVLYEEIKPKNGSVNIWADNDEAEPEEEEEQYVSKRKVVEVPDAKLPELAVDLKESEHHKAWEYLINRGYTKEVIEKLNLKVIPYSDYKELWADMVKKNISHDKIKYHLRYMNRIIFPLYIEGVIKGFIARSFIPTDESMKVMNSEGNFRANYFWNYDNVKNSKTIAMAEGISDAVKCGVDRSIALLGTAAAEGQLDLLKKINPEKLIFVLDVGTEKNQLYIYEKMVSFLMGEIYTVEMEPLLTQKDNLLNNRIKEVLQELCDHDIDYFRENELHLPYYVYLDVKRKLKQDWFTDLVSKKQITEEDLTRIKAFFSVAKYRDAGDHSFSEMNEKIKKAKKVNKEYYENILDYYKKRNLPGF